MDTQENIRVQAGTAHINKVIVTTSARLHFGFYDLGFYGLGFYESGLKDTHCEASRMFGSLGVSLSAPETIVEISTFEKQLVESDNHDYVAKIVENLISTLKIKSNFSIKIHQAIPAHAGLGSGTQLALAIGAGLNALFGLNLSVAQIASANQRGARSGIGIGAFEQGGFLVDNGKIIPDKTIDPKHTNKPPCVLFRHDFPSDWRILLVSDAAHQGAHGAAELQAFRTLQPAKNNLRDMVFNHMLPALQRSDLLVFGAYMSDLQAYNGAYFAPVQGGHYASQDVAKVLTWLQTNGAPCVGQSSWGPTGFAIVENQQQADVLQEHASKAFASNSNISFQICRGKNTGAEILLS